MTDLRTAAQQALEAIEDLRGYRADIDEAITALRAALVEPEQDRALQWGAAPARIEFNSSHNCWREAFLPLGKDNTLRLLAETEALPLVENSLRAALAQQAEPVEPVACCDLEERKALSSVKLPCDVRIGHGTHRKGSSLLALVVRSRSLYQMAKSDDYYGYASRLAVALWEKHYKDIAPQWKPLDDLMGVLTQIDNMVSGLARLAQQAEPVDTDCHTQGICQRSGYGIGKQADPQIEDRLARHGINPCPDCRGLGYDASGQLCWCQQNPSF